MLPSLRVVNYWLIDRGTALIIVTDADCDVWLLFMDVSQFNAQSSQSSPSFASAVCSSLPPIDVEQNLLCLIYRQGGWGAS